MNIPTGEEDHTIPVWNTEHQTHAPESVELSSSRRTGPIRPIKPQRSQTRACVGEVQAYLIYLNIYSATQRNPMNKNMLRK
jgi:hypothetical protein